MAVDAVCLTDAQVRMGSQPVLLPGPVLLRLPEDRHILADLLKFVPIPLWLVFAFLSWNRVHQFLVHTIPISSAESQIGATDRCGV
ncbi:unnamed protein product [Lasius platythorax]|uniref:Uncharacterized protein n=2 Tax=Lasius TaxID=488720 RepID=A0A0J7KRR5_LASNI|nr:hypothetical protein RF55_9724 [Lasius niger]KMQ92991.1 hypothetical protein RF55_6954 [Lasius niger]